MLQRGEEVTLAVGASAEGDHRRVLDEKQLFFAAGDDGGVRGFLEGPGLAVGKGAEVAEDHGWGIVVGVVVVGRWAEGMRGGLWPAVSSAIINIGSVVGSEFTCPAPY